MLIIISIICIIILYCIFRRNHRRLAIILGLFSLIVVSASLIIPQLCPKPMPPENRREQVQAIELWLGQYLEELSVLHQQTEQYQTLLAAFKNDEIDLSHVISQLQPLHKAISRQNAAYNQKALPHGLDPDSTALIKTIHSRTQTMLKQQELLLKKLLQTCSEPQFQQLSQTAQGEALEKLLILENPPYLNVSHELSLLKESTLPLREQ